MAGIKISALPALTTAQLTDFYPLVQGGVTYKGTNAQLLTLFNGNIQIAESQVTNLTTDLAGKLSLSGGTMSGNLILNADPTTALQAVTKQYADNIAAGLNPIPGCVAASTTALTVTYANGTSGVGATLTNATTQAVFSLDGVSATVGQRILIKDQASAFQNGIYTVTNVGSVSTNWVLTRATDYNTPGEIEPGDLVAVSGGTVNIGSSWLQTATVTTVGTDSITFSVFFQPSGYLSSTLTSAHIYVGNASNIGTNVAVSGDLTLANTGAFTIANSAVTNAKMANMNDQTIKGNVSGGAAAPTDLTKAQVLTMLSSPINSIVIQTFTSTGTYTPTSGMKYCIVEGVGGGGGGGGVTGTVANQFFSSGGGGGAYSRSLFTAAAIGASKAVVIGAAGSAGAAANGAGGNGGTTTFGSTLLTAPGGSGPLGGITVVGGAGGVAGTGNLALPGMPGQEGAVNAGVTSAFVAALGGNSMWGWGGTALDTCNHASAGGDGTGYGGGGGGANAYNSNSSFAGGAGTKGALIVTEYISS